MELWSNLILCSFHFVARKKCIIYQVIIQTQLISLTCISEADSKAKFTTSEKAINSVLQAGLNTLLRECGQSHTNTACLLLHFATSSLVTKAALWNISVDMVECSTNGFPLLVRHYTALQRYPVEHSYVRDWHYFLPACELARLLTFTVFFLWTSTVQYY